MRAALAPKSWKRSVRKLVMTKCLFCMMSCFIVMATAGAVAEGQSLKPEGWDTWMFHCHILDHAEVGVISTVDVGDIDTPHGEHSQ